MIRRPPRSTQSRSSAASDVYKRQPPRRRRRQMDRDDECLFWRDRPGALRHAGVGDEASDGQLGLGSGPNDEAPKAPQPEVLRHLRTVGRASTRLLRHRSLSRPRHESLAFHSGLVNIGLPLAVSAADTSSCITSQCSTTFPSATRKMSTAIIGFGPQPV